MMIPIIVFRLLACLSTFGYVDQYIILPVAIIGVMALWHGVMYLNMLYVLTGSGIIAIYAYLRYWVEQFPQVPDADDVDHVVIGSNYPSAPALLDRNEIRCGKDSYFIDSLGRRVLLRGVNLSGSSKLPLKPDGCTWNPDSLKNPKEVSFVNRPFKLSDADIHLARLRAWGFNILRLVVTWESVEHGGPGNYDTAYLDYLVQLVRKCKEYGFGVIVDMHQDVWSRWTGGDGAPAWTLELVGFNLDTLDASGAAHTMQTYPHDFPKMVWNSNNFRLAAGTMWTIFFAGNDYCAKLEKIDGMTLQDYLQSHFCGTVEMIAKYLENETNVIGFDVLNEPSNGFIGCEDITSISKNKFFLGWRISPWVAIQCGVGLSNTVDFFDSFMHYAGRRVVNEEGVTAWRAGFSCIWKKCGVWDYDTNMTPVVRDKHFFRAKRDMMEYVNQFTFKATSAIRKHIPDAIIFTEPAIDLAEPNKKETLSYRDQTVWAKHWYDGITLMTKRFSKVFGLETISGTMHLGLKNIEHAHGKALAKFKDEAKGMPVLIGECGIPFDMRSQRAYRTGDFSECICALNTTMRALEIALVSATLWNYTPNNLNKLGDQWNEEDLSIFSSDQIQDKTDLHAGGRALLAAVRPYAMRVAGIPMEMSFDIYQKKRPFYLRYRHDPSLTTSVSVIFIPRYHYPHGVDVLVSDGSYSVDWEAQTLLITHASNIAEHWVSVSKVNLEAENYLVPLALDL